MIFQGIRERMQGMDRKEKVEYYLEYYGWRTFGILLGVLILFFLVLHFFTNKKVVLGVLVVNSDTEHPGADDAGFFDPFLEENGYDTKKVTLLLHTGLHVSEDIQDSATRTNMETIYTLFGTGSVDVFFADEVFFMAMGQSGLLADLSGYLSEDLLEKKKDSLICVTEAESGKEIVAGLRVKKDTPFMKQTGWYEEKAVVGLSAAVKSEKLAARMLREAIGEEETQYSKSNR